MMNEFVLVDTDVLSFGFKSSRYFEPYKPLLQGRRIAISFVTVAELYKWAIRRDWGPVRVQALQQLLKNCVVVPFSAELAWKWAEVTAACDQAGRSMDAMDAWVAATAIHRAIPLVTHNASHFEAAVEHSALQLLRPPKAGG